MSLFDKFMESSPLTFQLANKFSSKIELNYKKHVLFEGELNVKTKDNPPSTKFFKIVDRKFVCSLTRGSSPIFFYDLMYFLKISHDTSKTWFSLEKFDQRHEFSSPNKEVIKKCINVLKLYCISNDFQDNYKILEVLGKGHFSQVYKVKHIESNHYLAAKHMKLQSLKEEYQAYIHKEIKILKSLPKNAHIIKLYEIYEHHSEIILIFEYMSQGDLYKKIKGPQLTEVEICFLFCQILKGLVFLHSNGIVHRDLKPDNILITKNKKDETVIKIADFSLAEYYRAKNMKVTCGTPGYMAPEIFSEENYDEKVDIFSLGIILFLMFTKKSPFHGKNSKEVLDKNKICDIKFKKKDWADISHSGKKLVMQLVSKYPGQRIALQNIYLHKWVRKNYYQMIQSKTANLDAKTENNHDYYEEYNKHAKELHRSQSEILDVENDYNVPTEKSTQGITYKTQYVFIPKQNIFVNSDFSLSNSVSHEINLNLKSAVSTTDPFKQSLRVNNESKEGMKLNTVNSLFLCSRSSITSDNVNFKSKSSISEEIFAGKCSFSNSRRDDSENSLRISTHSPKEKNFKNGFTLFKKNTNIFTEPIKEITGEENTNKTNQTMEYEGSPVKELMADLIAESKPKKPSKHF